MEKVTDKVYLGDGLYAQFDGWHIRLTAEDGINVLYGKKEVFLEPNVLEAFLLYVEQIKKGCTP